MQRGVQTAAQTGSSQLWWQVTESTRDGPLGGAGGARGARADSWSAAASSLTPPSEGTLSASAVRSTGDAVPSRSSAEDDGGAVVHAKAASAAATKNASEPRSAPVMPRETAKRRARFRGGRSGRTRAVRSRAGRAGARAPGPFALQPNETDAVRLPLLANRPRPCYLLGRYGESHSPVVHKLWVLVVAGSNPASPTKLARRGSAEIRGAPRGARERRGLGTTRRGKTKAVRREGAGQRLSSVGRRRSITSKSRSSPQGTLPSENLPDVQREARLTRSGWIVVILDFVALAIGLAEGLSLPRLR